eukprot:1067084-Rhodomonas_salina.1
MSAFRTIATITTARASTGTRCQNRKLRRAIGGCVQAEGVEGDGHEDRGKAELVAPYATSVPDIA